MDRDDIYYFECACYSEEHVLRFAVDEEEGEIYACQFMRQWHNPFKRIWIALKYVFGYKSQYGHFDCWLMLPEDADRMIAMCERIIGHDMEQSGAVLEENERPCL